jgi:transcriptional regulator with XRE-family HTH domain
MRVPERKAVDDKVIERMLEVMREKRISQRELVEYLGLANGTFTSWKYKGGKSYMSHMDRIAEYLGVSKVYLTCGEDEQIRRDTITRSEAEIIRMLRDLDQRKRELSYQIIKGFWEDEKKLQAMKQESLRDIMPDAVRNRGL